MRPRVSVPLGPDLHLQRCVRFRFGSKAEPASVEPPFGARLMTRRSPDQPLRAISGPRIQISGGQLARRREGDPHPSIDVAAHPDAARAATHALGGGRH